MPMNVTKPDFGPKLYVSKWPGPMPVDVRRVIVRHLAAALAADTARLRRHADAPATASGADISTTTVEGRR